MTQSATKPIDVDKAIHILRVACQTSTAAATGPTEDIADLLPSAPFLAQHCTAALLSSVLEACDATTPVAGAPKKLAMLNAAWKLLLAIAAHDGVQHDHYEKALLHMVEQLRWGVLTHDWSDKKRVRLATFFASHIVLAVRAHPQLLLTGSEAARSFLVQLVHLHLAVCVTVATSTRDGEAVATLYDNIAGRLHGIFDCLGAAAAAAQLVRASCEGVEGTSSDAATGSAATAVEELLTSCVSASAASEVVEAAGGGRAVQEAAATAALSAYLHVLQGVAKEVRLGHRKGSGGGSSADETDAAARTNARAEGNSCEKEELDNEAAAATSGALPAVTLRVITDSLLSWTGSRADGDSSKTTAPTCRDSAVAETNATMESIAALSALLPLDVFAPVTPAELPAPSVTLRSLWVSALTSLWQQWVYTCAEAEAAENTDRCKSEEPGVQGRATTESTRADGIVQSAHTARVSTACDVAQLSLVILSFVTGGSHPATAAMMALEAWCGLLRLIESDAVTSERSAVVRVLMRVLAVLRGVACDLVEGLLHVCRTTANVGGDRGCRETTALMVQWACAIVALLGHGECTLGIKIDNANDDEKESRERCIARTTLSQLLEVFHAQSCVSSAVKGCDGHTDSAIGAIAGRSSLSPDSATAELRDLLTAVQRESREYLKQKASSALRFAPLCRLLVQVPRRLHNMICAFSSLSLSFSQEARGSLDASGVAASLEQLKQSMLSCSSLFAGLTQTLQSCAEVSAEMEEEEEHENGSDADQTRLMIAEGFQHRARVARWVAARLVYETAAVPVTDSADDAVLLACVRRWTDVAFSSSSGVPPGAAEGRRNDAMTEASRRCGDAVLLADAAGALLRVAEECTTIDLERLNLSEGATAALMTLLDSESQDRDGADDAAQWRALQDAEAHQWAAAQLWLRRETESEPQPKACQQARDTEHSRDTDEQRTPASPLTPPSTAPTGADYLRGLQYCESLLQQLLRSAINDAETSDAAEKESKRRRIDGTRRDGVGGGPRVSLLFASEEATSAMRAALARISQLSHSVELRLGGGDDDVVVSQPSSTSTARTARRRSTAPVSQEEPRRDTQVFTLSDTESLCSRRRPSSAEVIDIE